MSEYERKIAQLRPLDKRSDVDAIFPHNQFKEHGGPIVHGLSAHFGVPANRSPDGISSEHILEHFQIMAPFSWRYDFYGFTIGMTLSSAHDLITRHNLLQGFTDEKVRIFRGNTPDDFGIILEFRRRPQGQEVLVAIYLSRPNLDEISQARSALYKKIGAAQRIKQERENAWKNITDDDDAMLMDWARHCKPWTDYSETEFIRYAKWLRSASADERHMAAVCWNWDYGYAPLIWIYRRPDCDLATALHILFGCEPTYYLKFEGSVEKIERESGHALEAFHMMMELKNRIESGLYSRAELYFDVAQVMGYVANYRPSAKQLEATLPRNLKQEYPGRRIMRENNFGGLRMPEFKID